MDKKRRRKGKERLETIISFSKDANFDSNFLLFLECRVINIAYYCFQTRNHNKDIIEVPRNTSLASEAAFFSVILDNDVSC